MARVYSSKVDPYADWILSHYQDYTSYRELTKATNETFEINLSEYTLRDWLRKQLNTTNVYGVRGEWSEYEINFLKDHYEKHGSIFVAQMLKKSIAAVTGMAFRLGVTTNNTKHRKETPIGTIRMWSDSRGGQYPCIKYAPGNSKTGWMPLARYIWEQEHGPIPKNHQIIYLNGYSSDCYLENIEVVTQPIFLAVTQNKHYKSHEPEITKCLIRYYQLREALGVTATDIKNYERKFRKQYSMEVE